jgi:hypothetical protein
MPGLSAGRAIGQPDFNKWRCGSRSSAERHSPGSSGVGNSHRANRNFRKVNEEKKAFTLNVIASFQVPIPGARGRSTLARNDPHRYGPS